MEIGNQQLYTYIVIFTNASRMITKHIYANVYFLVQ